MSTQKVIIGALIGVAAGAVAGILFAPEKGSSTREKLSDSLNDLKDKYNDAIDQITSKLDAASAEAKDEYGKGRDVADSVNDSFSRS